MTIIGNIFAGLIGLGVFWMFRFASGSTERYDYIVAGFFSLLLLVCFLVLLAAISVTGKLDFLGWPRLLQFGGGAIACVSLTVVMGMAAALHGSEGREFPWSIRPFCPWAAYMIPLLVAVIGVVWLNGTKFGIPASAPAAAFGLLTAVALLSNVGLGVEIRMGLQRQSEEQERDDHAIIQQTDAEKEFYRLLHYSSRFERPSVRQQALEKIVATGPRFDALMSDCLRTPVFEEGLTYLRDNDPPGDPAPLAEPARDAITLMAQRLREQVGTGRPSEDKEVELRVESVLTVAGKFAKYGVDFVPVVRDCRAALETPKSARFPTANQKKMDAWLARKGK